MSTAFLIGWIGILILDGLLLAALDWAATTGPWARYRVRTPGKNLIPPARKWLNTSLNNLLALLIFIAFLVHFGERLLVPGWPGAAQLLGETLAVLLTYDLAYYVYHRTLHHPRLMKLIHGVHHRVRYPTASESIYLHPLEQIGALAMLLGAIALYGPIAELSFLMIFFIYSVANIIVHANVVVPHPAFRLFNFWVQRHDIHHDKFRHNYASIFPFWDQAFGTYR